MEEAPAGLGARRGFHEQIHGVAQGVGAGTGLQWIGPQWIGLRGGQRQPPVAGVRAYPAPLPWRASPGWIPWTIRRCRGLGKPPLTWRRGVVSKS